MSKKPVPFDVPTATRASAPGWKDPRLWVGVVLVTASVVAGARVMAAADDSVQVWAAAHDLEQGTPLESGDLVATSVRFVDAADAGRYLGVEEEIPQDLRLLRGVGAGELVPGAALGEEVGDGQLQASLSLDAGHVPTGVRRGSTVDVWVVEGRARGDRARVALAGALVADLPAAADSFAGAGGRRQVVIGVDEADAEALGEVLAATGSDAVRLVARG